MISGYMVDTNIFNAIADELLSLDSIKVRPLYATSIQRTELAATKSDDRRKLLIDTFHEIAIERLNTSVGVYDVSVWDQANFGSDDQNKFVEEFAEKVRNLDNASGKRAENTQLNSIRDALIAQTALENQLVLLTGDKNLHSVALRYSVRSEFIEWRHEDN